jgi:hypothetical protein
MQVGIGWVGRAECDGSVPFVSFGGPSTIILTYARMILDEILVRNAHPNPKRQRGMVFQVPRLRVGLRLYTAIGL